MRKAAVVLLFALALALALGCFGGVCAADDFVIDENGVLTEYKGPGGDVTIPEGVTAIGDRAFYECCDLTSVLIPKGVTSIGSYAFSFCSTMTGVTIPESLASIGFSAFSNCSSLTGVTIPAGVTEIKASTFSNCSALTNVSIPDSVMNIGAYAFSDCSSLTSVAIPESVITIGQRAFSGCNGLESLTIPKYVQMIGDFAFSGCNGLTSLLIPKSVQSIGIQAFELCTGLTSVTFTPGVMLSGCSMSIGDYAFYGCSALIDLTIPDSVTSIGDGAFSYCAKLTSIKLPKSVTTISDRLFVECWNLTSVTIPESVTSIGAYAFSDCSSLTGITIPRSMQSIGTHAFEYCTGLCSVSLPAGEKVSGQVLSVGEYAFTGCSDLTNVTILDSVTSIGDYAFYSCRKLENVKIPEGVTSIGSYAFKNCSALTSVSIPSGVTVSGQEPSIGYGAFWSCTGLTSITIPGGMTNIDHAFIMCSKLTNVTIPESVISIKGTFESCTGLTSVTLPNGVKDISGAFYGCTSLTSVTLPNGVTNIETAFYGCTGLKSVELPESVTNIGDAAFYECTGLTSVTIPKGVTSIGSFSFYYCKALTSVTIPLSVSDIKAGAFNYCDSLTDIYYGGTEANWSAINIGESNEALLSASFHCTVEAASSGILREGNGWKMLWKAMWLEDIYGNRRDPELVIYMDGSNPSEGFQFSYSEIDDGYTMPWFETTGFDKADFVRVSVNGTADNPIAIITNQFYGYSALRMVSLSHVYSIGSYAFKDCASLECIYGPDSDFISFDSGSFQGCTSLTYIMGDLSNLESIGKNAFANTSLGQVALGRSVTTIKDDAFSGSDVTIICYLDSCAHQYAKDNGIPYYLLNEEEKKITYSFDGKDYTAFFGASELSRSPTMGLRNGDLATLCAMLSNAAYSEKDVHALYQQMGLQTIRSQYYEDYCFSSAFGNLPVSGTDTNVLVVAFRGSKGAGELFEDVFSGITYQWGYKTYDVVYTFANLVLMDLNMLAYGHDELQEKPLKIIITGHSLGGAAANLLAAHMNDLLDGDEWWSSVTDKESIYVYTFGAIDSLVLKTNKYRGYENIHNVFNLLDSFGPNGGLLVSAKGDSMVAKFGHIDIFEKDYRGSIFQFFENHKMHHYLDAVANGDVSENSGSLVRTRIGCPVDVEVYREGAIAGKVIDNEVEEAFSTPEVTIFVVEDVKYIVFPRDKHYEIFILATDEGKMEYSVEGAENDEAVLKGYSDVLLEDSKSMFSEVGTGIAVEETQLLVVDGGDILSKVQANGKEVAVDRSALVIRETELVFRGGTAEVTVFVENFTATSRSCLCCAALYRDGQMIGFRGFSEIPVPVNREVRTTIALDCLSGDVEQSDELSLKVFCLDPDSFQPVGIPAELQVQP